MPKTTKEAVDTATEAATLLVKSEIERLKLKLARSLTKWVTQIVVGLILMLLGVVVLVFLGFALSGFLQEYVTAAAAYGITAGIYLLLAATFYAVCNRIIGNSVLNNILNDFFDEE